MEACSTTEWWQGILMILALPVSVVIGIGGIMWVANKFGGNR